MSFAVFTAYSLCETHKFQLAENHVLSSAVLLAQVDVFGYLTCLQQNRILQNTVKEHGTRANVSTHVQDYGTIGT